MKITPLTTPIIVPAETLRQILPVLIKSINRRSTLPILSTVRFIRANGAITIEATDLDRHLCYTHRLEPAPLTPLAKTLAELRWTREGTEGTCVPLADLRNAAKAGGNAQVTITATHLHYQLSNQIIAVQYASQAPNDFPGTPELPAKSPSVILKPSDRAALIEARSFASHDETRYVLNGIYLEAKPEDKSTPALLVATDGRRLYAKPFPSIAPLRKNILLPNAALDVLSHGALTARDWQFSAHVPKSEDENGLARIQAGPWCLTTKLIKGNYPRYQQILQDQRRLEHTIDVTFTAVQHTQLIQILRGLPPCAPQKRGVHLTFLGTGLALRDDTSNISATVQGVCATAPMHVAVDRYYLLDILAIGVPRLTLLDEMTPLRFTVGNADLILMPMRTDTPAEYPDPTRESAERKWLGAQVTYKDGEDEESGTVESIHREGTRLIAAIRLSGQSNAPCRRIPLTLLTKSATAAAA